MSQPPTDRPTPPGPAPDRARRRLLGVPLAWATACAGAVAQTASARPPVTQAAVFPPLASASRFELDLDARAAGTPVNQRVLGSNVQWVDNGDDLLGPDGRLDPGMLQLVRALGPTVLRYPGGAQTDAYHWERGMGPLAQRGENEHVNAKRRQPTRFGTREFLELCEACGAEPLISVNVASGSVEEAARWIRATNVDRLTSSVTGRPLPRVAFWELGNEPYLTQERPDLALAPAEYARRADRIAAALRGVDPQAVVGLPLSADRRNGVPALHVPGFTRAALAEFHERLDFASLHDAYMPFAGRPLDPATLYWGAMGATRTVRADMDGIEATLRAWRPGARVPLAITEYSAMFTLGQGATDDWAAAPAAALYEADALRLFASSPDVLLANHWSLSGNWRWGAIHSKRFPRPAYTALQWMSAALQGERVVPAAFRADTIATPSVGQSAAVAALPLVEVLATRERLGGGTTWRIALIQKDPRRGAEGRVSLAGLDAVDGRVTGATLETWTCDDLFDARDDRPLWHRATQPLPAGPTLAIRLPAASLALLTITLTAR